MSQNSAVREAVRLAERAIDHQIAGMERTDLAIERMLRLAIASLAGALAIIGLLQQATLAWHPVSALALLLGVLAQAVAAGIMAIASRAAEVHGGPTPADMYASVAGDCTKNSLLLSTLEAMSLAHRNNQQTHVGLARRLGFATWTLIAGTGLVVLGVTYLVWRTILA